jgi:hypothetical protein
MVAFYILQLLMIYLYMVLDRPLTKYKIYTMPIQALLNDLIEKIY